MRAIFLLALLPLAAHAEMHKCTLTNGKVEYTDQPCAAGTKQQKEIAGYREADGVAEWREEQIIQKRRMAEQTRQQEIAAAQQRERVRQQEIANQRALAQEQQRQAEAEALRKAIDRNTRAIINSANDAPAYTPAPSYRCKPGLGRGTVNCDPW